MKFTYTATTKEGKTVHGTMEATSRDAVMAALNRQGAKSI